jgi:hypothetical protein
VSTLGWIVSLKDGRRLYLELVTVDIEGEVDELTINALATDVPYPSSTSVPGPTGTGPIFSTSTSASAVAR